MQSDKQLNDAVVVNLGEDGLIRNCRICGIKFSEGKVRYDIWVETSRLLLENIDSYFVEYGEDRFTGRSMVGMYDA